MTSRELLALALIALPALATVALPARSARACAGARAPGRSADRRARADAARSLALGSPSEPLIGDWLVLDAAGGLLLGVIGLVGLASVLVSPAYLDDGR